MGTIYNHNVTRDEINKLKRMIPGRRITDKNNYEKMMSRDIKLADLYRLYKIRGDYNQAKYFFNKIEDATLRYLLKN